MMTRMRAGKLYVRRGIQAADIKYFFIASCFQLSKCLLLGSTPDDSDKVTGDERHQALEFTDESWWARPTPH